MKNKIITSSPIDIGQTLKFYHLYYSLEKGKIDFTNKINDLFFKEFMIWQKAHDNGYELPKYHVQLTSEKVEFSQEMEGVLGNKVTKSIIWKVERIVDAQKVITVEAIPIYSYFNPIKEPFLNGDEASGIKGYNNMTPKEMNAVTEQAMLASVKHTKFGKDDSLSFLGIPADNWITMDEFDTSVFLLLKEEILASELPPIKL